MPSTVDQSSALLAGVLTDLGKVSGDLRAAGQLLSLLGWTLPPGIADIGLSQLDISVLVTKIEALTDLRSRPDASDVEIAAALAEVGLALKDTFQDLQRIGAALQATPEYLSATHIADQFFPRLADLLFIQFVGSASPAVVPFGVLMGVFELTLMPADPSIFQPEYMRQVVRWDRFGPLFSDPTGIMRDVYGWGTPQFQGPEFVTNFGKLLEHFCDHVRFQLLPRAVEERIVGHPVPEADADPAPQLMSSIVQEFGLNAPDIGVALFPLRPTTSGGTDAGLGISPFAFGAIDTTFELSDTLSLELATTADLEGGVALVLRPDAKPQLLTAFLSEPNDGPSTSPASFTLTLKSAAPVGKRQVFFSALGFTADAASVSVGVRVDVSKDLNPSLFAVVDDGRIVFVPDQSDGFLASVLPKDGITATVNLTISYSHSSGLAIEGGVGLSTQLVLNSQLGPILLNTVDASLTASPANLTGTAAFTASVLLGPVTATISSIGTSIVLAFERGNLGPVDLSFNFKPPSGVGLSVDAGGVSGGGFLSHDDTTHEYAGVLQLQFSDLALQAFGLITTQVAGADGYSLLALIDADFPPIQLGWGFTLNGVGGLLAIHRTASVDALHAALKADKLGNILFPKNAITNAAQILTELDALFPTAPGRFLFGPMALIGWGTPTLLTVALAIIIELPEPIRIILLARLAVRLPSESDSLLRINMDALGVLDLGQDSLSLDATLFDSRLLKFALSGDMALRANWSGETREFLLSVGGFHPRFTPPAGFPTLKRMSIDMTAGSIAKIHLESYLAITSNTLQIGANLHVVVKVSSFSIDGHLGFDALFQRNPFHFDGDISGAVAVSIDGYDLLSVSLDATLTGPAPWNIAGDFKVHIVFFDVRKSFSQTWGDDAPADQIAPVDVGALLATTFADPRSWGAQLSAGTPALVSARDVKDAGTIVAHPLALLEVHERTVPLGMDIVRIGGAPLRGANNFTITDFHIGGKQVPRISVQDDFAPAEFLDMSDDDKLAQPSFERHDAGVRLSSGLVISGSPVTKQITYETFFIDETGGEPRSDPGTPPQAWLLTDLQAVLSIGSASRAGIMSAGNRRYTAPGNPIRVAEQAFVLVDAETLAPVGIGSPAGGIYSDVRALLNQELNRDPAQQGHLQIVATHEMVTTHA
jgi:hypothetical protein